MPKECWKVTDEQVKEFATKNNLVYFETSCKTKQGINEGYSYIVKETLERTEEKKQNIKIGKEISEGDNSNCVGKNKKNKKKK